MKKLVFFVSRYPFRVVGESFFESELATCAKEFDRVYVVTCNNRLENPELLKKLPENVTAVSAARGGSFKKDIIRGALALPFNLFFWKELSGIFKGGYGLKASVKSLLYSGSFYLSIKRSFPKIKSKIDISDGDSVVFAGYWLSYISRAIVEFRKYLGRQDCRVVSRVHGSADVMNIANPGQFYPFQRYLLSKLDAVYAVSDAGCNYLKKISPKPERIKRIYIGSHGPGRFIERKRQPFTVMTCANLFPLKRIDTVADAVKIIASTVSDIRWIHFGGGPQMQSIKEKCSGLEENVRLCGYTPHDEVMKYLASGEPSLFVSASATEGLPISVVEAGACSVPVVATDVGATKEAVNGKNGTLTEPDVTPQTLADYILKYYSMSDEEYAAISKNAFEFWKSEFDCESNGKELSRELVSLL